MNIAECKEYEKILGVRPVKEFLDYYLKLSLFLAGAFPEKFGHIIKYPLKTPSMRSTRLKWRSRWPVQWPLRKVFLPKWV